MEDGMYVRKELKIEICERGDDNVLVIVTNNEDPTHPIVKHGESARALVMTLLDQLDD